MLFSGGTVCHNGISRGLTVHLTCSDVVDLSEVKEVSICVYEASLSAPGACRIK